MSGGLAEQHCVPCRGDVPPLRGAELRALHSRVEGAWRVVAEHHLEREYAFRNFREALDFAVRVGEMAEREQHHPDLEIAWGRTRVKIWTHKIDGLTESDFVFAAKCDAIDASAERAL